MKLLSPEVALYLYKSTICACKDYFCHVWAGAPSCYFELLDNLQKRICRTIGPALAAFLEALAHHPNVTSLSIFTGILQNWLNWFHFLLLEWVLIVILIDCMIFLELTDTYWLWVLSKDISCYGARMTKFSTNPYFIFQCFECYTKLTIKELLYNESQIFYFYFKVSWLT